MRYPLRKERLHLFSPAAMIALKIDIKGDVKIIELRRAIKTALRANELMCTHIVLTESGEAYFEPMDEPYCPITTTAVEWPQLIRDNERRLFALADGELARFFIIPGEPLRLLICAHRLIGDGTALVNLAQDILTALDEGALEKRPIALYDPGSVAGALSFDERVSARLLSFRWSCGGRSFNFRDLARLCGVYEPRDTFTARRTLDGDCASALARMADELDASSESIIATAFLQAFGENSELELAVSLREGYVGMGDYETDIGINHAYDAKLTFAQNVRAVHRAIGVLLDDPHDLLLRVKLMDALTPTLIDASYFAAFDGYGDPLATRVARLRGLDCEDVLGLSVLNHMPLRQEYGECDVTDCAFVPALAPGMRRAIGAAVLGERVVLTLRARDDENAPRERELFDSAVDILRRACSVGA